MFFSCRKETGRDTGCALRLLLCCLTRRESSAAGGTPQHSLDHTEIVKKLNIDAFVVGDDWFGKYDYLKDLGVQVFYFPYGTGVSSSNLKKTIHDSYEANLTTQRQAKPETVKGSAAK